jgi:hypothetical protein
VTLQLEALAAINVIMESTHKQEFHIRDVPTQSVTLFPSSAQVVRAIKDVQLKVSFL